MLSLAKCVNLGYSESMKNHKRKLSLTLAGFVLLLTIAVLPQTRSFLALEMARVLNMLIGSELRDKYDRRFRLKPNPNTVVISLPGQPDSAFQRLLYTACLWCHFVQRHSKLEPVIIVSLPSETDAVDFVKESIGGVPEGVVYYNRQNKISEPIKVVSDSGGFLERYGLSEEDINIFYFEEKGIKSLKLTHPFFLYSPMTFAFLSGRGKICADLIQNAIDQSRGKGDNQG